MTLDRAAVLARIADYLERNPEVQSYTIDGVTVTRSSLAEVLAARDKLLAEQARETTSRTSRNVFRRGAV